MLRKFTDEYGESKSAENSSNGCDRFVSISSNRFGYRCCFGNLNLKEVLLFYANNNSDSRCTCTFTGF
ncbi:MAG: hypothetical protein AB1589_20925 [Cyanobacteriota bacterium]